MSGFAAGPSADLLFERLARGEAGAIDEVCVRYGARVASIARGRLGRSLRARVETADVAQEAMLEIVKGAPGACFQSEAEFLRWVRRVVENKILLVARRWKAVRRRLDREQRLSDTGSWLDPHAERPSQVLERHESMDRFSLALAGLPQADRAVVICRLLLELPWSRVAECLGTSEEAVQMRFTRARRRLQSALG